MPRTLLGLLASTMAFQPSNLWGNHFLLWSVRCKSLNSTSTRHHQSVTALALDYAVRKGANLSVSPLPTNPTCASKQVLLRLNKPQVASLLYRLQTSPLQTQDSLLVSDSL